jgi:hypothetical protein
MSNILEAEYKPSFNRKRGATLHPFKKSGRKYFISLIFSGVPVNLINEQCRNIFLNGCKVAPLFLLNEGLYSAFLPIKYVLKKIGDYFALLYLDKNLNIAVLNILSIND